MADMPLCCINITMRSSNDGRLIYHMLIRHGLRPGCAIEVYSHVSLLTCGMWACSRV